MPIQGGRHTTQGGGGGGGGGDASRPQNIVVNICNVINNIFFRLNSNLERLNMGHKDEILQCSDNDLAPRTRFVLVKMVTEVMLNVEYWVWITNLKFL